MCIALFVLINHVKLNILVCAQSLSETTSCGIQKLTEVGKCHNIMFMFTVNILQIHFLMPSTESANSFLQDVNRNLLFALVVLTWCVIVFALD